MARLMGATHTIDANHEDVKSVVAEITGGDLAEIVVEAVGRQKSLNQAVELLPRHGTLVYFGVPNKDNTTGLMEIRFGELFGKEARVVTSVGPNPHNDFVLAHQWISEGRVDVRPIVTHVMPFEQIQQGFETAYVSPEENEAVKVVLKF
jgi:L-iditol 2-dehydrogenase